MTKEFNLSEFLEQGNATYLDSYKIKVKFVKKFIKELKEELIQENVWDEKHLGIIDKKINTLAGKELVENDKRNN